MSDDGLPEVEKKAERDQNVWTRLRGWTAENQATLLLLVLGVTAATVGVRGRADGDSVVKTAGAAMGAVVETAAESSERVYREFSALGKDYKKAAMNQTVERAVRRYQRWTPEELAVLADAGKTALEKALELRRTFEGVMSKSIKEGLSSKAP